MQPVNAVCHSLLSRLQLAESGTWEIAISTGRSGTNCQVFLIYCCSVSVIL